MSRKNGIQAKLAALAAVLVISASGCGKGSSKNVKIDGVSGPNVNFVDNKLTMSVVIKNLAVDGGISLPLPHMPNSGLQIGPDFQSNGYMISVFIDANDIKALAGDGVNVLDPTTLPGGRPLPGVIDGQLPGMAIEVPKLENLVFYAGKTVFGVFVPVKMKLDVGGSFRFYDGAGDAIGTLSLVPRDGAGKNSGFLLLINLQGKVGKLVKM